MRKKIYISIILVGLSFFFAKSIPDTTGKNIYVVNKVKNIQAIDINQNTLVITSGKIKSISINYIEITIVLDNHFECIFTPNDSILFYNKGDNIKVIGKPILDFKVKLDNCRLYKEDR